MTKRFDILNYLDRLRVFKQTNTEVRYYCPVCGHSLSVNTSNGKWKCWAGCDNFDVKKLLRLNYITIGFLS